MYFSPKKQKNKEIRFYIKLNLLILCLLFTILLIPKIKSKNFTLGLHLLLSPPTIKEDKIKSKNRKAKLGFSHSKSKGKNKEPFQKENPVRKTNK